METTIVSYLTARPSRNVHRLSNEIITRDWWGNDRATFDVYTSDVTVDEAGRGDPAAAAERLVALADLPRLAVVPGVLELAGRLAVSLQLPKRAEADALHLAVAAVHGIEFLLTWNCTHLANGVFADKIERSCVQRPGS